MWHRFFWLLSLSPCRSLGVLYFFLRCFMLYNSLIIRKWSRRNLSPLVESSGRVCWTQMINEIIENWQFLLFNKFFMRPQTMMSRVGMRQTKFVQFFMWFLVASAGVEEFEASLCGRYLQKALRAPTIKRTIVDVYVVCDRLQTMRRNPWNWRIWGKVWGDEECCRVISSNLRLRSDNDDGMEVRKVEMFYSLVTSMFGSLTCRVKL